MLPGSQIQIFPYFSLRHLHLLDSQPTSVQRSGNVLRDRTLQDGTLLPRKRANS